MLVALVSLLVVLFDNALKVYDPLTASAVVRQISTVGPENAYRLVISNVSKSSVFFNWLISCEAKYTRFSEEHTASFYIEFEITRDTAVIEEFEYYDFEIRSQKISLTDQKLYRLLDSARALEDTMLGVVYLTTDPTINFDIKPSEASKNAIFSLDPATESEPESDLWTSIFEIAEKRPFLEHPVCNASVTYEGVEKSLPVTIPQSSGLPLQLLQAITTAYGNLDSIDRK